MSAPNASPVAMPIENDAWKCGITARRIQCSTLAASAFMATLVKAKAKDTKNWPIANHSWEPKRMDHATVRNAAR